jgi:hypothetical protein
MNKIERLTQELQLSQYQELVQSQNYPAIAQLLNNRPLINNPEAQQTVLKRWHLTELFVAAQTSPQEAGAIYQAGLKQDIEFSLNNNLRENLSALLSIATAMNLLSSQSANNIQNCLNQTELDPTYKAQIQGVSRAEELNIYPVYDYDIQAALNPITELINVEE